MTITSGNLWALDGAAATVVHGGLNTFIGVEPIQYRAEDLEDSGDATKRYYVPTVSGIESSQYFLNRLADRHCVSGVEWEHACGPYDPQITTPFKLAGYPLNDLPFWQRYKDNIIAIGNNVGRDFSGVLVDNPYNAFTNFEHRNWYNQASNTNWSGHVYECDSPQRRQAQVLEKTNLRALPVSGMHTYGPMLKEDFETFISNPQGASNPGFIGYATYNRQKSITGYTFGIQNVASSGTESSIEFARTGTSYGGDDICYNVSGHLGVPILLGYKNNTNYLFHEVGNSRYTYPDTAITVSGIDLGPDHEALVFYSGFEVIYETQQYHLVGTANFKPLYEWGLFNWGEEGSGLPIASGANIVDFETWTPGGGLYNKNQSTAPDIQYTIFNGGTFYPSDTLHRMSGIWTGPVESSLFVDSMKINFSTTQKDRFAYFPLEGQNSGHYGFRQLTGIITSGVIDAYGYHTGGRGDYNPTIQTAQQFENGGWPAATKKTNFNSQDQKTDWGIPQSYCILPVDMHLHAKVMDSAEEILDYMRSRDFDVVDTINFGPVHYGSGEVPINKIGIHGSDPFVTHFAKSGSFSSGFKKQQNLQFPADMLGCEPTGKYIVVGLDMPLDSGAILPLTENKEIQYFTINRNRAKVKGTIVDIALRYSGAFSYKCIAVETVSNPRSFETGWGDWVYGHAAKSPNNGHGTDVKLIFPDIMNSNFTVTSSSTPETYFGVGGMKMPIEPLEEIYLSGDTTNHYRI